MHVTDVDFDVSLLFFFWGGGGSQNHRILCVVNSSTKLKHICMMQRFQPTLLNSPGAETEGAGLKYMYTSCNTSSVLQLHQHHVAVIKQALIQKTS